MKKLLFLIGALGIFLTTNAQIPAPIPGTYVNDVAGKLTKEQLYTLNDSIASIEKKTSVQIAILLIPELPADMDIADYARSVGNIWKVGNAQNGVVYVASLKEHQQRLEVARNVEGDLPDELCLHITDDLKPYFRAGDYYTGLQLLVSRIASNVDPDAKEQLALQQKEKEKEQALILHRLITAFGWLLGSVVIGFLAFYKNRKNKSEKATKEEEYRAEQQRIQNLDRAIDNAKNTYNPKKHKHHRAAGNNPLKAAPPKPGPTQKGSKGAIDGTSLLAASAIAAASTKKDDDDDDSSSSSSYSSSNDDSSNSSGMDFGSFGGDGGGGFSGGGASNDW